MRGHIPILTLTPGSPDKREIYSLAVIYNINEKELHFYAAKLSEHKLLTTTFKITEETVLALRKAKKSEYRGVLEDAYQYLLKKLYVDEHRLCIDSSKLQDMSSQYNNSIFNRKMAESEED